ncbi:MAG: helix-turn-helix domain-containing protein [Oscillospiraceae bacterium]|nr:helix-turn-helix domain-containing protein [Oscillospiraceae bacterium]
MESKKTFGEYICKRRKELGMTQKEFADKLYVTESAVSKWERGLSYPDITLLLDICAALDVTEHELLTASVDTQKRAAERMAEKYQRLTRNFCIFTCLIFGGVLIGCGIACIVNSDFWILPIAVASVMIAASVTALPFLLARRVEWEPYKWAGSLGGMVFSVELLILFCCVRAGAMAWFPMVSLWVLFGSCLLLLPVVLLMIPLPPVLAGRKTSLGLAVDTVVLLLALIAIGFTYGYHSGWFYVAVLAVLFGTGFITLPVYLGQLPLPEKLRRCKTSLFIGVQSALLLLLLTACCGYSGGAAWDVCPVVLTSVFFGLCLVFLPVPLRQIPLPEPFRRHKALLYFAVNTTLLFILLAAATREWFFPMSVPIALLGLILPWGWMGIIRYLPVNGWFKASLCCVWTGLWTWLYPWILDKILLLNGWPNSTPYRLRLPVDFSRWDDPRTLGWNIFLLALAGLGALAVGLMIIGGVRVHSAQLRGRRSGPAPE